jgi:hypothetical protein
MRNLKPGQPVRVEHNAMVIGLADENNPYWYIIEYPTGERETVSLARINQVQDRSRGVVDHDGSLQIFSPRLSALGGLDLLEWLLSNEQELRDAAGIPRPVVALSTEVLCQSCHTSHAPDHACQYAPHGSNYHDHLCLCPGCNPQPPDGA